MKIKSELELKQMQLECKKRQELKAERNKEFQKLKYKEYQKNYRQMKKLE
jgi:hypothetical protein|nr:MAG TPA: hypothetical protein [Siphoviridae sp. ctTYz13]